MTAIFRFKKDQEFGQVRHMNAGMTPATTRLFTSVKPGDKATNFKLPSAAIAYVKKINTKIGYQYLQGKNGGWVNTGQYPQVEQLAFQGDLFIGYRLNNIWTVVYTWKFTDNFNAVGLTRNADFVPVLYFTQKWWNIKRDGSLMPGKTFKDQSNIILISDNGYLFVENYKVMLVEEVL